MKTQAIVLGQDGSAEIRCPNCGVEKIFFDIKLTKFHVICKCNSVYGIEIESRKKDRKATHLDGFVEKFYEGEKCGKIISQSKTPSPQTPNCKIRNISEHGIGLITLGKHKMKEGDHVRIEYSIDNSASSRIEKKAVVKRIKHNSVGCEFLEMD